MESEKLKKSKILVACPTASAKEYCMKEWVRHTKNLTYDNYDVFMADNSERWDFYNKWKHEVWMERVNPKNFKSYRHALAESHNRCRAKVISGDYDYLLHLESDVFPPIDIIERLLEAQKPVVGALYHIELGAESKLMLQDIDKFGHKHRTIYNLDHTDMSFVDGSVKRIHHCGLGCVLIKREVLERVEFRYEDGAPVHPDSIFFADLDTLKVPVFVDTSILCKHKNTSLKRA